MRAVLCWSLPRSPLTTLLQGMPVTRQYHAGAAILRHQQGRGFPSRGWHALHQPAAEDPEWESAELGQRA